MEDLIAMVKSHIKSNMRGCNVDKTQLERNFEIYERVNNGAKINELAKEYGVSTNTIRNGYKWAKRKVECYSHRKEVAKC